MRSNKTHIQTSSDSESVDDIQTALFINHLDGRSCDGEKRPLEKEIETSFRHTYNPAMLPVTSPFSSIAGTQCVLFTKSCGELYE
jgi:hypothetical protein